MSDLTFSIRLTADGSNLVGTVKQGTQAFKDFSEEAQRVVDRYNPVEARIRAVKDAIATLNAEIASAPPANAAVATQTVAQLTAELKQLESAGGSSLENIRLGTAGVTREIIVLGHEVMQGNFSRIPGSLVVMAERMGGLHALLNPTAIGFAAVAAAVGVFAFAMEHAAQQTEELERQIQATGNFAGVTAQQVNDIALAAAQASTLTVGAAKDIATQIVASGRVGAENIGNLIKLTDDYANVTHQSTEKAAAALLHMFDDPAKAAEKLNDQYHFLTASQLEQIKSLEQMGDKQGALNILIDALDKRLPDHAAHLSVVAEMWNRVAKAVSGAIGAAANANPIDAQIAFLQQQIARFDSPIAKFFGYDTSGLKQALAAAEQIKNDSAARAKSEADTTQYNAQQVASAALIDKYAKDASERAALLAAKQQIGLYVATTPEEAAKQVESLQAIDKALADLDKKAQGPSDVRNALLAMDREVLNAQIALDNVGRTMDTVVTPAMRKLADLKLSDTWAKMTAAQKAHAEASAAAADALERQTLQAQAALKVGTDFANTLAKMTTGFDQAKAKADAETESLQKYGVATRDTHEAQLDFFLSLQSTQTALAALDAVVPGLSDMLIANARAHAQAADAAKANEQAIADLTKAQQKATQEREKGDETLDKEAAKLEAQARKLGLSKEALDQLKIAELDAAIATEQRALALAGTIDGDGRSAEEIQRHIDALTRLRNAEQQVFDKQVAVDFQKALDKGVQTVSDDLSNAIIDAIHNGGQAGVDDLKRMFDQLVLRPIIQAIIQPILGNIAGGIAGAIGLPGTGGAGGLGGSNPLSFLSSGSGGGIFGQLPFVSGAGPVAGAGSGIAGFLAGQGFDTAASFAAGVGSPFATISTAVSSGLAAAGGVAGIVGAAVPLVGAAIAAASFLGVFDHKPSPVQGQFQISSGTGGFEDNAYTASAVGNLGFNDANTQQFSGQAAQVFNQVVGGAIDAFEQRYSPEQRERLAQVLQQTTFPTFSGTFTTEDFIKQYGGQVLQQVVVAAFNVLDPALASVAANFKGTADDVAKFANTLLGIYDATRAIGNDAFTANVDQALQGADQTAASDVLALVGIVSTFGTSLAGLGPQIEALDPDKMAAFVESLGGAQKAADAYAFVNDNFTTSADKASQAQTNLANAWTAAGVTADDLAHAGLSHIPQTHAEFLKLLDSLDLNTDHGKALADALLEQVAPAFVAVEGTADAAAQALNQQAQTGLDYYNQHFLTPAQQTDLRVSTDETTLYNATKEGTLLNGVLHTLGYDVIPTTRQGVQDLVNAVRDKYGADSIEYKTLLAIIPTIGDLNDATNSWGDSASNAADAAVAASAAIDKAWQSVDDQFGKFTSGLSNLAQLAGAAKDFGTQLVDAVTLYQDQVDKVNAKIAAAAKRGDYFDVANLFDPELSAAQKALDSAKAELALFQSLSAQYGADVASQLVQLEERYETEKSLYAGNATALAIAKDNFTKEWNDIINGTTSGVSGTLDQLERLKQGIADYLKSLFTGNLSPLTPQQQLAQARAVFDSDLAKAQGGDQTALGNITKDADELLKQGSSFFSTPSQAYRDLFAEVTNDLGSLAGTLPNGLPLAQSANESATSAIANALPTNGTLASSNDIAQLGETLRRIMSDVAAGNSEDIAAQTEAITTTTRRAAETVTLK